MNIDPAEFTNLADQIGAAATWDKSTGDSLLREFAVQQAYQKKPPMTEQTTQYFKVNAIVAGVRSCILAAQVLRMHMDPLTVDERLAVSAAHNVLEIWGIDLTQTIEPDEEAGPPPVTLTWPPVDTHGRPLTTTLPDVYKENYYHAREKIVRASADGMSGTLIIADNPLVLKDAYWNEEKLQWRMLFTCGSLPQVEPFWVDHCKVRVGDEIPKASDVAGAAGSAP